MSSGIQVAIKRLFVISQLWVAIHEKSSEWKHCSSPTFNALIPQFSTSIIHNNQNACAQNKAHPVLCATSAATTALTPQPQAAPPAVVEAIGTSLLAHVYAWLASTKTMCQSVQVATQLSTAWPALMALHAQHAMLPCIDKWRQQPRHAFVLKVDTIAWSLTLVRYVPFVVDRA